jgi:hypothetical protein
MLVESLERSALKARCSSPRRRRQKVEREASLMIGLVESWLVLLTCFLFVFLVVVVVVVGRLYSVPFPALFAPSLSSISTPGIGASSFDAAREESARCLFSKRERERERERGRERENELRRASENPQLPSPHPVASPVSFPLLVPARQQQ